MREKKDHKNTPLHAMAAELMDIQGQDILQLIVDQDSLEEMYIFVFKENFRDLLIFVQAASLN